MYANSNEYLQNDTSAARQAYHFSGGAEWRLTEAITEVWLC